MLSHINTTPPPPYFRLTHPEEQQGKVLLFLGKQFVIHIELNRIRLIVCESWWGAMHVDLGIDKSTNRWMRFSRVVRASNSHCRSRNCPGFDPSVHRHSGIWWAADETVLNTVHNSFSTRCISKNFVNMYRKCVQSTVLQYSMPKKPCHQQELYSMRSSWRRIHTCIPLEINTLWWGLIILQTTANTLLLDFQNLGQNEKICHKIRLCGTKQSVDQSSTTKWGGAASLKKWQSKNFISAFQAISTHSRSARFSVLILKRFEIREIKQNWHKSVTPIKKEVTLTH